ncbi:MAG TPA: hypothetical protein VLF41_03900, partial [Candidatus Nanoarchaeia archaeon]|nr:hypothetical protein [Candidatus Nanoarchaeia archaeon]
TATVPGNHAPVGFVDSADCNHVVGWAKDGDTGDPITVHIYVGGTSSSGAPAFPVTANVNRSDVGNHGFDWTVPDQFKNGGTYPIYVYGINVPSGANPALGNSAKFAVGPCSAAPPPSNSIIEGYKVLEDGSTPAPPGDASVNYVCCDSGIPNTSANPFFFNGLRKGDHRISVNVPSGYTLVSIQCQNTGCVGSNDQQSAAPGTYGCTPGGICDSNSNSVVINTSLASGPTVDIRWLFRATSPSSSGGSGGTGGGGSNCTLFVICTSGSGQATGGNTGGGGSGGTGGNDAAARRAARQAARHSHQGAPATNTSSTQSNTPNVASANYACNYLASLGLSHHVLHLMGCN